MQRGEWAAADGRQAGAQDDTWTNVASAVKCGHLQPFLPSHADLITSRRLLRAAQPAEARQANMSCSPSRVLAARSQSHLQPVQRRPSTRVRLPSTAQKPHAAAAAAASGGSSAASGSSAVLILPGFLFSSRQYAALAADLRAQGHPTGAPHRRLLPARRPCGRGVGAPSPACAAAADIVPTSFADWLPSFSGGSFEWYLARLDATLADLHAR